MLRPSSSSSTLRLPPLEPEPEVSPAASPPAEPEPEQRTLDERERVEALTILDDVLRYVEYDDDIRTGDHLAYMLDTPDDDEAIVAKHGDELGGLTGIVDRAQLLRWVTLARPEFLRRHADDLNAASASMDSNATYVVVANRAVVREGEKLHPRLANEIALRSRLRRLGEVIRPLVRVRARDRAPRGRRLRRSPARSPDRPPPPPARHLELEAAAA